MIYNIFITDISYDFIKEMKRMELHALGMDYHHDEDFLIERPDGSGDDLLIIFKTPAMVRLNGIDISTNADTAIVYSKGTPQIYGADGAEYINHWIHFDMEGDSAFFRRIGLPLDTLVEITDISSVEDAFGMLSVESLSDDVNREECTSLLLRLLLARLGGGAERSRQRSVHYNALCGLRGEIYREPNKVYTVESLAEKMSLSAPHFQALYKEEFGVSCYEDVINARLEKARYYLKNTSLPVKTVAELCGYANDVHFIRQFRQRTGMTAGEFRKNGQYSL